MSFKTLRERLIALTHLRYQAMQNDDTVGRLLDPLSHPMTTWKEVRQQEAALQHQLGESFTLDYDTPRATYILLPRF